MIEAREECVHHWIIEIPNGALSKGACKLCGSERLYYNSLEYMWEVMKALPSSGNPSKWRLENTQKWVAKQDSDRLARD